MEFKFSINKLLPRKISKVTHTLIPEDFKGDRRELSECQRQLAKVLDEMGEASARAQDLNKSITSAHKLRDTDHIVYLLVDSEGNNGHGCVVGMLKTGSKNLFMFDEREVHYQLRPRCVLDFYVHESRQRMGCGNVLYQHMLTEENIRPVKLAIDRPSEKFLAFLKKYYGLSRVIPQNNKFVVFQGFFDDESRDMRTSHNNLPPKASLDATTSKNGNQNKNIGSANGIPHASVSRGSYGRYAASRPPCSMANIIHNTAMLGQPAERTGDVPTSVPKLERPRSLSLYSEEERKQRSTELATMPTSTIPAKKDASFVPINVEAEKTNNPMKSLPPRAEEVERSSSQLKPSPSCAQEVVGNESGHLDLKFYHSPLW
ncbi:alpha-tubulin N-acetyltransferase [Orussus abietinus]|uniref:alpha-tubulin N-acetyltransferase n=1 Tax=Orussus abietinus TaxID=222816 RepID=UPI0006263118|nr:alpha-tubulin N-acetyltransferase [Orussus abietinus]